MGMGGRNIMGTVVWVLKDGSRIPVEKWLHRELVIDEQAAHKSYPELCKMLADVEYLCDAWGSMSPFRWPMFDWS
jgi:hypothetical protein